MTASQSPPSRIRRVVRPPGMPPTNGYSHVVAGTGELVTVSGQLPIDEAGDLVGEGNPLAQARRVFHNIDLAYERVALTSPAC